MIDSDIRTAKRWGGEDEGSALGLQLTRSQKLGAALVCLIAVVLAVVLAAALIGPVLNVLGLQAVGA